MTKTTTAAATTPGKRRRALRLAAATLIGTGLALALAGCGSGSGGGTGVASLDTPDASASTAPTSGTKPSALAYSRCMRSHGIKDFPDPNASGDIALEAGPGSDLDPQNPTFKSADAACKPLMPHHEPPAGLKAASTKYSACMRDHGVKDFPDPHADGTLQIQATPGSDLDPNNPTFKAANEACEHYMPKGDGGGSSLSVHKG